MDSSFFQEIGFLVSDLFLTFERLFCYESFFSKYGLPDLIKRYNAKLCGNYIFLEEVEVKNFMEFLDLTLNVNRLCQQANDFDAKMLFYDALIRYEEAMHIVEELGDLSLIITCSNNMGLIFESLGDLPQALVNFERAYKISTRVEDVLGKAIQLCNIGRVFEQEEKFVKAIHFFKESYATFSQINLGTLHIHLKEEVKSHIKRVSKIIYQ